MFPRLYILMRTDMDSMNAGKAMAQAAHAANAFAALADAMIRNEVSNVSGNARGYLDWKYQTSQSFGTTITLASPDLQKMTDAIQLASQALMWADVVLDPTYPVRDGKVTHLVPVKTCGYVFVPNDRVYAKYSGILSDFTLHP